MILFYIIRIFQIGSSAENLFGLIMQVNIFRIRLVLINQLKLVKSSGYFYSQPITAILIVLILIVSCFVSVRFYYIQTATYFLCLNKIEGIKVRETGI